MSRTWDDRVSDHLERLVDHPSILLRKWSPLLPEYSSDLGLSKTAA